MMSVKYLAPNNYTYADLWYGDWIVVSPLANFMNEFENADGSTATAVAQTNGKVDITAFTNASMATRDPRMAKTIFVDKFLHRGVYVTPSNARATNIGLAKFLSPNLDAPYQYSTQSQQDWVLMRYADVLLMKAEVEHERRVELAFEGERYFDLKRWKIAPQVLNNVTDGIVARKFESKHYLWPLPQSEIDKNRGILVQNPNY